MKKKSIAEVQHPHEQASGACSNDAQEGRLEQ